jgi:hypothetical protein
MRAFFTNRPAVITFVILLAIVALNVWPYRGNVSSFFHLSDDIAEAQKVPQNFIVLTVPAYDGAHYYQIARNIPLLFSAEGRATILSLPTLSYAYQRMLLPITAFILSAGQVALLPYAFLLINILAIVGTCMGVYSWCKKSGYALALAFSPSAMVALHFNLAEPLTLLLLTLFLVRFLRKNEHLDTWSVLFLSLLTWSREVNILLMALLTVYLLWRTHWKDALLMIIPVGAFLLLHWGIYELFGSIPFLDSAGKRTFPFEAMWQLVRGGYGYNRLTITSIPLALLFVLPSLFWTIWLIIKNKDRSFLVIGSAAFLLLMTTMPDHIWGSITSIGRVITPVYPLTIFLGAKHGGYVGRYIAFITAVIGLGAAFSLAFIPHPFILS